MDRGSSTCFLGDVVAVGFGAAAVPRGAVMTAAYFREHLPAAWRPEYERHLKAAQDHARATSHDIAPLGWTRRERMFWGIPGLALRRAVIILPSSLGRAVMPPIP